jgi:hypothetical protein
VAAATLASTALVTAAMRGFAAFAAYLCHVLAVLAYSLATLTSDPTLLFRIHGGKTAL